MKTYKLPITITDEDDKKLILELQRQQSCVIRWAYNRFIENKSVKELEKDVKQLNNIDLIDSWFARCGILSAKYKLASIDALNKTIKDENEKIDPKKVKFGSKKNFFDRLNNKITNTEYKEQKLNKLEIQGEQNQGGNRKFNLDLENNKIIFKPYFGKKIELNLPKLRKNWLKELLLIQETESCYSVKLTNNFIWITVDEVVFQETKYQPVKNRVLGIDLNPDYIGYTISDIKGDYQKVVLKECFELKELHNEENNKIHYELIHLVKKLIKLCQTYQVEQVCIEELNIKSKNYGNKKTNKKNNNDWNRNLFINKLKMDCNIFNIKLVTINPGYSSFIGNMQHNFFDPISASLEIARRGFFKFIKGKFYPTLEVTDQWKKYVTSTISTWKEFYDAVKILKLRYRIPLDLSQVGFRIRSRKSKITFYSFI